VANNQRTGGKMKKIGFVLCLGMMLMVTSLIIASENQIQIKEKTAFSYVCMSFRGPIETMPEKIMTFMREFFKQRLQPAGALI
jgi:hypothetical protein